MSVYEKKLPKVVNLHPIPGHELDNRNIPPGLFKPSFVGGFSGATGSGKSTSLLNMLQEYQKSKTYDRYILFSPSAEDDPKYKVINWDEVHENYSDATLRGIVRQQDEDMKEWRDYVSDIKLYNRLANGAKIESFTKAEKIQLFRMMVGGELEKPTCRFDREPYICVVFDDLGSSPAYSNNAKCYMNAMACRCRHKNMTMIHAVQYLKQLPRALRNQCLIMAIFKTKDMKLLKDIANENASSVTEDEFIKLFEAATQEKHDFLLCDFLNETFRKNFNNLLLL